MCLTCRGADYAGLGFAMPVAGPLHDAAILVVWFTLPVVTIALLIVVHEAAHALTGWALRFRVTSIDIGGGPIWSAFWIGAAKVTLARWPTHGFVHVVRQHRRFLRTRMVLFFAAGPAVTIACAVSLHVLASRARIETTWSDVGSFALTTSTFYAWALAVASMLPMRWGRHGLWRSDMLQVFDALRLDEARIDAILSSVPAASRRADYWAAFLRGHLDRAASVLGPRPDAAAERCDWHIDASLLAFVRDGLAAAMEHQRQAEHAATCLLGELERTGPKPTPAQRAARHRLTRVLQVNRAFFLAHSDVPAELAEAAALAERWRGSSGADTTMRAAEMRTRGLVLLHSGRVGAGISELRRALGSTEEHWLRALGAAYLAYGHALRGETRKTRRYVRMANRLSPANPLLAVRLRRIEEALQAAAERAPLPAIR